MSESIDLLKVKPLPKKPSSIEFFIEKKYDLKLPTIIDKTKEDLVDVEDFMRKIQNQKNIYDNTEPVIKSEKAVKTKIAEKELPKVFVENILIEIVKTDELVKLLPYGVEAKTDKTINTSLGVEFIKKTDYIKPSVKSDKSISDTVIDKEDILGTTKIKDRLPPVQPNVLIKAPDYYLYNREIFIDSISKLFLHYREQLLQEEKDVADGKITINCDDSFKKNFLLTHQQIVRDYINIYTPYRGLLLYHGLGSGKTCSSIAIAEGIKII